MKLIRRSTLRYFACLVAALTFGLCFFVPFLFPPNKAVVSQAYAAGFNQHLSTVFFALISLGVFVFSIFFRTEDLLERPEQSQPLSRRGLFCALLICLLWTALWSFMAIVGHGRASDDFYFMPQLRKVALLHLHLYSQVEFAYGPLLFFPVIWVYRLASPLNISLEEAYYFTLICQQLLGIGFMFYVINRMPLDRIFKRGLFGLVVIQACLPLLGLNYTFVRFGFHLFALALLCRIRSFVATGLYVAGCALFAFYISPEMGIAFLAGSFAVSCCYFVQRNSQWKSILGGIGLALLLALFSVQKEYLASLKVFAGGLYATAQSLTFYTLIFLVSAAWFAPRALSRLWVQKDKDLPLVAGIYAASVCLLAPSLAIGDASHIMVDGIGMVLVSAVAFSFAKRRFAACIFLACYLTIVLGNLLYTTNLHRSRLRAAIRWLDPDHHWPQSAARISPKLGVKVGAWEQRIWKPSVDLNAVAALMKNQPFAMPFYLPPEDWQALDLYPGYRPSFFHVFIDVSDEAGQRRKIDEIQHVNWLISPYPYPLLPPLYGMDRKFLLYTQHLQTKHAIYQDDLFIHELEKNWRPVRQLSEDVYLIERIHPQNQ